MTYIKIVYDINRLAFTFSNVRTHESQITHTPATGMQASQSRAVPHRRTVTGGRQKEA